MRAVAREADRRHPVSAVTTQTPAPSQPQANMHHVPRQVTEQAPVTQLTQSSLSVLACSCVPTRMGEEAGLSSPAQEYLCTSCGSPTTPAPGWTWVFRPPTGKGSPTVLTFWLWLCRASWSSAVDRAGPLSSGMAGGAPRRPVGDTGSWMVGPGWEAPTSPHHSLSPKSANRRKHKPSEVSRRA
jgi:hypothetical protein